MAPEEQLTSQFVDYVYENYNYPRFQRHLKRLLWSVGPLLWKIKELTGQDPRMSGRQIRFEYNGRTYKGRYSHLGRGRLELVRMNGVSDGPTVAIINSLDEAMRLDLRAVLNGG